MVDTISIDFNFKSICFFLTGFIICDDTELCDKIIGQEVETEQRRRTLAKSSENIFQNSNDFLFSFPRKSIDIEKTDLVTLLRTEPDFILNELSNSPEWTATNVQGRFSLTDSRCSIVCSCVWG